MQVYKNLRATFIVMGMGTTLANLDAGAETLLQKPQDEMHCRPVEVTVVYIPNRTCDNLPSEYQGYVCACKIVQFGSKSYAKVSWGRNWKKEQEDNAEYNSLYYGR